MTEQPLPEFLAERLFEPLGMIDAGFEVPAAKRDRFTSYYRSDPAGGLELADAPAGQWSHLPAFPAGSGGLVGTVDDWLRFAQMILGEGMGNGRRVLSPESVTLRAGSAARGQPPHITPSTGSVAILLTQVAATDPVPPALMRDFWRHVASA